MLHFLRRHTFLAVLIFGATIISFVFFMGSSNQRGASGSANANLGTVYGKPVPLAEFLEARREARLSYLFRFGEWPRQHQEQRQCREARPPNRL